MKRLPPERARRGLHVLQIVAGAERRHGILAAARPLEHVTSGIELALNVPGLTGDSHLVLDDVVIGFQIVVTDGPVFESGLFRYVARAVALLDFRNGLEVPG